MSGDPDGAAAWLPSENRIQIGRLDKCFWAQKQGFGEEMCTLALGEERGFLPLLFLKSWNIPCFLEAQSHMHFACADGNCPHCSSMSSTGMEALSASLPEPNPGVSHFWELLSEADISPLLVSGDKSSGELLLQAIHLISLICKLQENK